ncbi:MAG: hypothetical protein ACFFAH_13525, partial [Promethearchaeota archaeon]
KIKDLISQIDKQKIELEKLQEKDNKIKELTEQIQYLENEIKLDTVKKSKYEKLRLLVEKKDEIITEKEKAIFEAENSVKSANQKINDLSQQLETFNLVKKDLEKKEERIKSLVVQIEEKIQKELTNSELINHLEANLEKAQKSSAKFELQLNNNVTLLNEKEAEIKTLKENIKDLNNKLTEGEKIEDKLLTDLQKIKDDKLKLESELEKKNSELIELKKKIKLMRRELSKSQK